MTISQVPRLVEKLSVWKNMLQFEGIINDLKKEMLHIKTASQDIMNSVARKSESYKSLIDFEFLVHTLRTKMIYEYH